MKPYQKKAKYKTKRSKGPWRVAYTSCACTYTGAVTLTYKRKC